MKQTLKSFWHSSQTVDLQLQVHHMMPWGLRTFPIDLHCERHACESVDTFSWASQSPQNGSFHYQNFNDSFGYRVVCWDGKWKITHLFVGGRNKAKINAQSTTQLDWTQKLPILWITVGEYANTKIAKEWPALLCLWLAYPDLATLTLTSPTPLA